MKGNQMLRTKKNTLHTSTHEPDFPNDQLGLKACNVRLG